MCRMRTASQHFPKSPPPLLPLQLPSISPRPPLSVLHPLAPIFPLLPCHPAISQLCLLEVCGLEMMMGEDKDEMREMSLCYTMEHLIYQLTQRICQSTLFDTRRTRFQHDPIQRNRLHRFEIFLGLERTAIDSDVEPHFHLIISLTHIVM